MKATFEIPDEIYRRAKARSAIEGRPLRAVVTELFEGWLDSGSTEPVTPCGPSSGNPSTRFDNAPWAEIARRHLKRGASHDLGEIRAAVARGWAAGKPGGKP